MIIRHRVTSLFWLPALLLSAVSAQPDSNCHTTIGDKKYDFSALSGEHTVSRTRSIPPTNMMDTLRFNICEALSPLEGVDASEQVRVLDHPCAFFSDDPRSVRVGRWPV
jgi:hypothetical protein